MRLPPNDADPLVSAFPAWSAADAAAVRAVLPAAGHAPADPFLVLVLVEGDQIPGRPWPSLAAGSPAALRGYC